MEYPKIVVDLEKLKENCRRVVEICKSKSITVTGITKSFCAKPEIAQIFMENGVDYLADARLYNLKKIKHLEIPKVLIRIPMKSTAKDVIKFSDISLNSELDVIKELSRYAVEQKKVHKVVLMVELGDLREGILEKDIIKTVKEVLKLKNIKLYGIGVNLTCYGAIIPTKENLGKLVDISKKIEKEFSIKLKMVTGGNSSSLYLIGKKELPLGINNLRIGEAIILGRETAFGEIIEGCYDDVFILSAEIIEIKKKKSIPTGQRGKDAFGNEPHYEDRGDMKRAILAVGRQDTEITGMHPLDNRIEIIGASSDHLIVDVTNVETKYKVGDIISFKLDYSALLRLMTSEYINKEYIEKEKIKLEQCNY